MLVESEEDATGTLRTVVKDSKLDVNTTLLSWGAIHTDLSKRRSTPDDIAPSTRVFISARLSLPRDARSSLI